LHLKVVVQCFDLPQFYLKICDNNWGQDEQKIICSTLIVLASAEFVAV